ncbi:MAG: ABC transporter substrate-binding protein, partial [Cyanobacteria bacterium P01_A01_bin.105]
MIYQLRCLRQRLRRILLVMLALGLAVTLANCNRPSPVSDPTAAGAARGALVFGSVGQPVTLESGNVIDGYSIDVQR